MTDDEVIGALTALRGLGRWSAEVYLLFCLCRPDVLPADDLALLTAAQRVKQLAERPTAGALRRMAEPWRPWRSVAARLLALLQARARGRLTMSDCEGDRLHKEGKAWTSTAS
jgi:DNA-3-methyladenine glycosylase II